MDAGQVASLLGEEPAEAGERLAALETVGLATSDRLGVTSPAVFRITSAGLRAIGSRLSAPGLDPRPERALGVGWLWLVASSGGLGRVDRVLSKLQMQAEDLDGSPEAPFDVCPGEFGGRGRVHYPDLMLLTGAGRVAVELLFEAPAPDEFAAVLRAAGSLVPTTRSRPTSRAVSSASSVVASKASP